MSCRLDRRHWHRYRWSVEWLRPMAPVIYSMRGKAREIAHGSVPRRFDGPSAGAPQWLPDLALGVDLGLGSKRGGFSKEPSRPSRHAVGVSRTSRAMCQSWDRSSFCGMRHRIGQRVSTVSN